MCPHTKSKWSSQNRSRNPSLSPEGKDLLRNWTFSPILWKSAKTLLWIFCLCVAPVRKNATKPCGLRFVPCSSWKTSTACLFSTRDATRSMTKAIILKYTNKLCHTPFKPTKQFLHTTFRQQNPAKVVVVVEKNNKLYIIAIIDLGHIIELYSKITLTHSNLLLPQNIDWSIDTRVHQCANNFNEL